MFKGGEKLYRAVTSLFRGWKGVAIRKRSYMRGRDWIDMSKRKKIGEGRKKL